MSQELEDRLCNMRRQWKLGGKNGTSETYRAILHDILNIQKIRISEIEKDKYKNRMAEISQVNTYVYRLKKLKKPKTHYIQKRKILSTS